MVGKPIECFVCGTMGEGAAPDRFDALGKFDFAGLFRCKTCGAEFWWPMNSAFVQKTHWTTIDPSICEVYEERHATAIRFLKRHLSRGSRVLDVGCRGGAFLRHVQDLGFEAYGIDPEPNIIAVAKAYHHLDNLFVGNFLELAPRFLDQKFDCITFFDVFEHVDTPRATLKAAASLLKPGGYIIFTVPNLRAGVSETGIAPYQWTRWSEKTTRQFLERNDFSVEVMKYVEPTLSHLKFLLEKQKESAMFPEKPVGLIDGSGRPRDAELTYFTGWQLYQRKVLHAIVRPFLFPVVLSRRTTELFAIGRYRDTMKRV